MAELSEEVQGTTHAAAKKAAAAAAPAAAALSPALAGSVSKGKKGTPSPKAPRSPAANLVNVDVDALVGSLTPVTELDQDIGLDPEDENDPELAVRHASVALGAAKKGCC